jgi:hypothetical protein
MHPAQWDTYGRSAGYRRNEAMADAADSLIAFWDGRSKGTKHMIELARHLNLEVTVVMTSGPTPAPKPKTRKPPTPTRGPDYRRNIDHSPVADAPSEQTDVDRATVQGFTGSSNESRAMAMAARERFDDDNRLHAGYCRLCNGTGYGRANWQTVTYVDDTLGWDIDGTRKPEHLIPLDHEAELEAWNWSHEDLLPRSPHSSPLATSCYLQRNLDDHTDDGTDLWEAGLHAYLLQEGTEIHTHETEASNIAYCTRCTGSGLRPGYDYPRWETKAGERRTTAPKLGLPRYALAPDQRQEIQTRLDFRTRVLALEQERKEQYLIWEKPFAVYAS